MNNLEVRILKLEAESLVAQELMRALIGQTTPNPITDAAFAVAVQTINAASRAASPERRDAIASVLARLNPLTIPRARA